MTARIDGATTSYCHFGEPGSMVMPTSGTGTVTDTYSYDAWGNTTHTGSTEQPYQYVGQLGYYTHYQDENLDLLQLGVRFYDPETGRFTQRDPLERVYESPYAYCSDNPLSLVDPSGKIVVCASLNFNLGIVLIRGGQAGWGMMACYDTCSGRSHVIQYGFVCSCWGLWAGLGFDLSVCLQSALPRFAEDYQMIGGGFKMIGFAVSWSPGAGCLTGGLLGVEIGGYYCRCTANFMYW